MKSKLQNRAIPKCKVARITPPIVISALTNQQEYFAACVHEAAHAVAAYNFGGWVSHDGCCVDLAGTANTGTCFKPSPSPEQVGIWLMCGPLAERKWLGAPTSMTPEDVREHLVVKRINSALSGDLFTKRMDRARQENGEEYCERLAAWSQAANEMLADPEVWHAIMAVAFALSLHHRFDAESVEHEITEALSTSLKSENPQGFSRRYLCAVAHRHGIATPAEIPPKSILEIKKLVLKAYQQREASRLEETLSIARKSMAIIASIYAANAMREVS